MSQPMSELMSELQFADEMLDRLQERNPRFHASSYIFVLHALHSVISSLGTPRHVTGQELADITTFLNSLGKRPAPKTAPK